MSTCQCHCSCSRESQNHTEGHNHAQGQHHNKLAGFIRPLISFVMLAAGIIMSHLDILWFTDNYIVRLCWYVVAFLPVGLPVIKESLEGLTHKDFFNEFTLMTIACIGAFCIGEFPEAVGVMLFYSIGETLQDRAVEKAKKNISSLLDVRGEKARIVKDGNTKEVNPRDVTIGEVIEIRPGERVPLDGVLISDTGIFDTSALTGESVPRTLEAGEEVLAGMLSTSHTLRIRVTKEYGKSTMARILELVRDAAEKKARPELFMRRFARVYTPVVMLLAVLVIVVPWIISLIFPAVTYSFVEWVYRALVFLVISCPCALVVSVPLGYFAGIGAASKAGILFKGGNYLEAVTKLNVIAFDKTGTLTTGSFKVDTVENVSFDKEALELFLASAELNSSHPLAKAIVEYVKSKGWEIPVPDSMREIPGYGVRASIKGHDVLVGNLKLMTNEKIEINSLSLKEGGTVMACAVDGKFAGYALLSDTIKEDSERAVSELKSMGLKRVVMLSGDKQEIADRYAKMLNIGEARGDFLPQDKMKYIEDITGKDGNVVGFVGDGMNDAPVLAVSDVGIAMGGLGSDAAIESADVVIQTDSPSKVATAIKIGKFTHKIVRENIVGAIAIKLIVLALGTVGIATLWGAVFADVGVALLAVLNTMRIMWNKY